MTKKDYIILATALAQAFSEQTTPAGKKGVEAAMEHIAHALQFDNPKFDAPRFVKFIQTHIR